MAGVMVGGNKVYPSEGTDRLSLNQNPRAEAAHDSASGAAGDSGIDDDILDKHLKMVWWLQTYYSMRTAIKCVWKKQVLAYGAEQTRDKLKSYWTTIGVVSALILGVSYSSSISPIQATGAQPGDATAASFGAVFSGISMILSLVVIVVATIYMIEIDNCTTTRDLADFINHNGPFFDILTGVFSASIVLLVGAALASMYVTYGHTEFLIVVCFTGFFVLAGGAFAAVVAGHNRFRLWARFDSPEAQARIAQRKRDSAAAL